MPLSDPTGLALEAPALSTEPDVGTAWSPTSYALYQQLTAGCGSPACRGPLCATGRRNVGSQSAMPPAFARLLAKSLAEGPSTADLLCVDQPVAGVTVPAWAPRCSPEPLTTGLTIPTTRPTSSLPERVTPSNPAPAPSLALNLLPSWLRSLLGAHGEAAATTPSHHGKPSPAVRDSQEPRPASAPRPATLAEALRTVRLPPATVDPLPSAPPEAYHLTLLTPQVLDLLLQALCYPDDAPPSDPLGVTPEAFAGLMRRYSYLSPTPSSASLDAYLPSAAVLSTSPRTPPVLDCHAGPASRPTHLNGLIIPSIGEGTIPTTTAAELPMSEGDRASFTQEGVLAFLPSDNDTSGPPAALATPTRDWRWDSMPYSPTGQDALFTSGEVLPSPRPVGYAPGFASSPLSPITPGTTPVLGGDGQTTSGQGEPFSSVQPPPHTMPWIPADLSFLSYTSGSFLPGLPDLHHDTQWTPKPPQEAHPSGVDAAGGHMLPDNSATQDAVDPALIHVIRECGRGPVDPLSATWPTAGELLLNTVAHVFRSYPTMVRAMHPRLTTDHTLPSPPSCQLTAALELDGPLGAWVHLAGVRQVFERLAELPSPHLHSVWASALQEQLAELTRDLHGLARRGPIHLGASQASSDHARFAALLSAILILWECPLITRPTFHWGPAAPWSPTEQNHLLGLLVTATVGLRNVSLVHASYYPVQPADLTLNGLDLYALVLADGWPSSLSNSAASTLLHYDCHPARRPRFPEEFSPSSLDTLSDDLEIAGPEVDLPLDEHFADLEVYQSFAQTPEAHGSADGEVSFHVDPTLEVLPAITATAIDDDGTRHSPASMYPVPDRRLDLAGNRWGASSAGSSLLPQTRVCILKGYIISRLGAYLPHRTDLVDTQTRQALDLLAVWWSLAVAGETTGDDHALAHIRLLHLRTAVDPARPPRPLPRVNPNWFASEELGARLDLAAEISQWRRAGVDHPWPRLPNARAQWAQRFQATSLKFSLLAYPFLLTTEAKARAIREDALAEMTLHFERGLGNLYVFSHLRQLLHLPNFGHAVFHPNLRSEWAGQCNIARFSDATTPYLAVEPRREFLLTDSLHQLRRQFRHLRQPLKVRYVGSGELGVDQGGVQKEWFREVFRRYLKEHAPSAHMWEENSTTLHYWLAGDAWLGRTDPTAPTLTWSGRLDLLEMLGIILGLALYNHVQLPLPFPPVFYKKLLGYDADFNDLVESFPDLGQGLVRLLEWNEGDGDVHDTFGLTFEITVRVPSSGDHLSSTTEAPAGHWAVTTVPLVTNGHAIPVTAANRYQYAQAYADYLLNRSVSACMGAVRRGFLRVVGRPLLALCTRPSELQLLLAGRQEILDFHELERHTAYEDRFYAHHPTIRKFWKVVHGFTPAQKRQLLLFVTANDRLPLGGFSQVTFVVQRNGADSDRLPTALTCFGRLLLPEYNTKEKLRERLLTAIQNTQGFGLV
ncbi:hypothetical protein IWQ60_008134 [Tieghemiomyces parasiticus]|uniref:HECT-type E3 ubiquitin transferase n=1 Tax=Tieghemiomyces parasiticus TaxID=78921 RepID=A0A9W7ZZC1_9FUNG|nr:hypothetical protein IWQ60_008134 [Tieghemiomyces parasiticus]